MSDIGETALTMEDRRWAALRNADGKALAELLADGMVYVHAAGIVDDRRSYLDRIANGRLRYSSIELSDRRVSVVGATAVIVGEASIVWVAANNEHESEVRYTSVWSVIGPCWAFAAWHATALSS
jgi:hypothetical protein